MFQNITSPLTKLHEEDRKEFSEKIYRQEANFPVITTVVIFHTTTTSVDLAH